MENRIKLNQVSNQLCFSQKNCERVMYSKKDNIEIMINDKVDELIR